MDMAWKFMDRVGGGWGPQLCGIFLHSCICDSRIAGTKILLMEEVLHQWKAVDPIIYRVLYIPGGFFAGFLKHQQY